MNKETFVKIIEHYKEGQAYMDKLNNLKIELFDLPVITEYEWTIDLLWHEIFMENGCDHLFWWLYEKNMSPELKIYDENNNEITCETAEELWDNLLKYDLK